MYDHDYAQTWILSHESRKDFYRTKYIEPLLKKYILSLPDNCSILDIGCGWGTLLPFLKKKQKYTGVEPVKEFFDYIKLKYPNIPKELINDSLPELSNLDNRKFDVIICSMILHNIRDLSKSLKNIINLLNKGGKLLIMEFRNNSQQALRSSASNLIESDNEHIAGLVEIASGMKVETNIYFHKEKALENILRQYGSLKKKYFGKIFVKYEL